MRAVFGVVSLLVVLAVVGLIAMRQLRSVGPVAPAIPGVAAASQSPVRSGDVGEQARQVQNQIANDAVAAMQQGAAARQAESDKP